MQEHLYWRHHLLLDSEGHHDHPHDSFHILKHRYAQCVSMMRHILENLREGQPLSQIDVATIASALYEDRESYLGVIHTLEHLIPEKDTQGDQRDGTRLLSVHCVNVALYSLAMATWVRLNVYQKKSALTAALLHDIGKVGIHERILHKPARLNVQEFTVIQQHPCLGYDIACQAEFLDETVCDSILTHHERMDGNGYPHGLRGKAIRDEARIIAVADTFDAITSDHVYKCKSTPFEALSILKGMRGHRLDDRITGDFLYHMSEGYMGASVLLSTGGRGDIVFMPPEAPHEPVLRVGNQLVDLSRERGVRILALA